MIGFLKGIIFKIKEQKIIINVRDVGYEVYLISKDLNILKINDEVSIYIYYSQKEDNVSLYGFLEEETKEIFERLISVNGIGAKMALSILSNINIEVLISAVINKKIEDLTNISGIGKKTAQRMILELQDKFNRYKKINNNITDKEKNNFNNFIINDAEKALLFLGYTKKEIDNVFKKILKKENVTKTEQLIKIALKELSK